MINPLTIGAVFITMIRLYLIENNDIRYATGAIAFVLIIILGVISNDE